MSWQALHYDSLGPTHSLQEELHLRQLTFSSDISGYYPLGHWIFKHARLFSEYWYPCLQDKQLFLEDPKQVRHP